MYFIAGLLSWRLHTPGYKILSCYAGCIKALAPCYSEHLKAPCYAECAFIRKCVERVDLSISVKWYWNCMLVPLVWTIILLHARSSSPHPHGESSNEHLNNIWSLKINSNCWDRVSWVWFYISIYLNGAIYRCRFPIVQKLSTHSTLNYLPFNRDSISNYF